MIWTPKVFRIWNIYFIGNLLCCIQSVKAEGQNETKPFKSFKRSFDFPPIFYPGPDNKFITVAPPPRLPNNLKVFVNNFGSPEITTFRPVFTSNNNSPTSPAHKSHKPPKNHTKPFRTPKPSSSEKSQEDSNSIQTHHIPANPTPRTAEPQHFRPTNPSFSSPKPPSKKQFRDHLQPTTFRPNNGHHFSTSAHPFFSEVRQNLQNKRPVQIAEPSREFQKRPNAHHFQSDSQQHPLQRPKINSFDSKRSKSRNPTKQFQPLPPQKTSAIPVYMPKNNHVRFSSTNRPFLPNRPDQSSHLGKRGRPPTPISPPPWVKTSSQSPPPNDDQRRPDFPPPRQQFPGNVNRKPQLKVTPQPAISKLWETEFPRYNIHDKFNKKPINYLRPSIHQQNYDEHIYITQPNQQQRPKIRFNTSDGRGFERLSPFNRDVNNLRFSCKFLESGYYADVDTGCETFHVCHQRRRYTFTCPKGTLFSQQYLICDWSNRVDCSLFSLPHHHRELY